MKQKNMLGNISEEELLIELSKRMDQGTINYSFNYFFDTSEIRIEIRSKSDNSVRLGLRQDWNVKQSNFYRTFYEVHVLPIVRARAEKEQKEKEEQLFKKLGEILKGKKESKN